MDLDCLNIYSRKVLKNWKEAEKLEYGWLLYIYNVI